MTDLYDTDIVTWSEQQALLLRQLAAGARLNAPPDWDNVIEEIESVGQSRTDAVESLLFQALLHDLKATGWPLNRDAENWRADARGFRAQARRTFSPSMRRKLDMSGLYADALQALPATMDGQPPQPLPPTCPVTLDELLAPPT